VIRLLKSKDVSFYSLKSTDHIPHYISVILTTEEEAGDLEFSNIVFLDKDLVTAVERAINISRGKSVYEQLVIGIDPGKRPGIAVVGDSDVVNVYQAMSVSKVRSFIERVLSIYGYKTVLVRIGHGAPVQRDQIINEVLDLGLDVEIVDETSTSLGTEARDIKAAISISFSKGRKTQRKKKIRPSEGEIKNLQRISRIESKGEVTISHDLAKSVLKGDLGMAEAIERQRRHSSTNSKD